MRSTNFRSFGLFKNNEYLGNANKLLTFVTISYPDKGIVICNATRDKSLFLYVPTLYNSKFI